MNEEIVIIDRRRVKRKLPTLLEKVQKRRNFRGVNKDAAIRFERGETRIAKYKFSMQRYNRQMVVTRKVKRIIDKAPWKGKPVTEKRLFKYLKKNCPKSFEFKEIERAVTLLVQWGELAEKIRQDRRFKKKYTEPQWFFLNLHYHREMRLIAIKKIGYWKENVHPIKESCGLVQ